MEVKLAKGQKKKIETADDIFSIMQKILLRENKMGRSKEHFWVIGVSSNNTILFIELVSLGGITQTTVEPGEVFQLSVHKDAVAVFLVHNHPSGELTASDEDRDITDRLIQSGLILHKRVLDHLIISEKGYYSFANSGLLSLLEKSTKYVAGYILVDRIKKEGKDEGIELEKKESLKKIKKLKFEKNQELELSVKNNSLEIAKNLLDVLDDKTIALKTGLSVTEIKKLR